MKLYLLTVPAILLLILGMKTDLPTSSDLPDLTVSLEKPTWNDSTYINVTVKNIGNKASKPVVLQVWDVDITIKEAIKLGAAEDILWIFPETKKEEKYDDPNFVIYQEIPALQSQQEFSLTVYVDKWVYDPNCEIGAYIDSADILEESDETNNKTYYFEGG